MRPVLRPQARASVSARACLCAHSLQSANVDAYARIPSNAVRSILALFRADVGLWCLSARARLKIDLAQTGDNQNNQTDMAKIRQWGSIPVWP